MADAENTNVNKMFLSEESIHALILVAGMIVISRNITGSSWGAILTIVATILVYFAGHIYAATVAQMAKPDNTLTLGQSIKAVLKKSWRVIVVAFLPLIFLSLGVMHQLETDQAVWLALAVDALILAAIGWVIARRKTKKFWLRIGGSAVTASFGLILIALKSFFYR